MDAWSMIHLSQQTRVLYCRLTNINFAFKIGCNQVGFGHTSLEYILGIYNFGGFLNGSLVWFLCQQWIEEKLQ